MGGWDTVIKKDGSVTGTSLDPGVPGSKWGCLGTGQGEERLDVVSPGVTRIGLRRHYEQESTPVEGRTGDP